MSQTTRDKLREQLKRREIAPLYALFGAETFQRDIAAKTIADRVFNEGDFRDFNEAEFSLNISGNLTAALSAAEQLPMMSARRVIRIMDVRVAATSAKDTLKEEDEQALSEYLKDPAQSSVVIFVADELNGNRRMSKLLKANSVAVEFTPLAGDELYKSVAKQISDAQSTAADGVIRQLIALAGDDLRRLSNETAKLSAAALPDGRITRELIDSLVPNTREISNFDLTDHLLAGNRQKALQTLGKILDDGAEPLALLGLISYNFRRKMMSPTSGARPTRSDKLAKALQRIAATDLAIKTSIGGGGPKGSRMQIEMLVCELSAL